MEDKEERKREMQVKITDGLEETEMQTKIVDDLFDDIAQKKIKGLCIAIIYKDDSFKIGWSGKASHLEKIGLFEQAKIDIGHTVYEEDEAE